MGDFIRSLLRTTSSHHRPWQLSAALALGVLCGVLPKFSLMFCLIGCVCCAAPIHLPLAALTCLISSIAPIALADTAGRVGLWSLTHPDLIEMWLTLNAQPWIPWLGLNNSVVHGSLLIGLALLLPVYVLSKPVANRLAPERQILGTVPADADFEHELKPLVARADPCAQTSLSIAANVGRHTIRSLAIETDATWPDAEEEPDVDEQTCQELENLLATCNGEEDNALSTDEVAQRAAQMAHFVDDLLTSCQLESTAPVPKTQRQDEPLDTERRRGIGHQPINPPNDRLEAYPTSPNGPNDESGLINHHADHANSSHGQRVGTVSAVQRPMGQVHQAEALRYLLHHLKAIKVKVKTDADQ